MALTGFQCELLKTLAANRVANAGSYVAGGLAFNHTLKTPRVSRDIDIFHDSREAMFRSWEADRETLEQFGCAVRPRRVLDYFIEAEISKDGNRTEIQWGTDSAYRFFPLVPDPVVGFTLHPLDLAANKFSALVGRAEPRDWIDAITAIRELQPLICLLSVACGKDPGYSPKSMLEFIARRHYNQVELDEKILPTGAYNAAELCRFWHEEVARAWEMADVLPREEVGKAVMTDVGELFKGTDDELKTALEAGKIVFHEGEIGGAWPRIIG